MNPVEQAHQNLKSILLTGRILVNGLPLTGTELSGLLQGEQLLFERASQFDKIPKQTGKPPQKKNVLPFNKKEKK